MFRQRAALGAALLVLFVHQQTPHARPLTLAEAFALAEQSPALGAAAATVDEARGNLEQAGKYNYNPSLSASAGPAWADGTTFFDYQVGIVQGVELGGKRGARRRVAAAERDASAEQLAASRISLTAEVRRTFQAALVAQARVTVTAEAEAWAREFREAALERMRLGAATQTEVNVAVANLGRAVATKKTADRDLLLARQALAQALGIAGAELEPVGALPAFPSPRGDERALISSAIAARRDLAAAERTRSARQAQVELADAQAVPDPALSVSFVRSAVEQSNSVVFGLGIDLPLWNRNQGARHAARAAAKRATLEVELLRANVERDVHTAVRRYQAATDAVAAFDQQVVGKLGENLQLARETLAAGKLGLLDVNNVRRELVESQLTYLDAIAEAVDARSALERALGHSLEETP